MSKEKKKGSCLKTVLIVIVALVILGAIGSTMSKDDDKVKDVTAKRPLLTVSSYHQNFRCLLKC